MALTVTEYISTYLFRLRIYTWPEWATISRHLLLLPSLLSAQFQRCCVNFCAFKFNLILFFHWESNPQPSCCKRQSLFHCAMMVSSFFIQVSAYYIKIKHYSVCHQERNIWNEHKLLKINCDVLGMSDNALPKPINFLK